MNPSHPAVGTAYYRTPLRDRAIRASGQYRRPTTPKVDVRLSEVSSGPWARGSLSYGTGSHRQPDRVNGGIC